MADSDKSNSKKSGFDPTELPSAIRKTWDSIVPPLLELALVGGVLYLLLPPTTAAQWQRITPTLALLPPKHVQDVLSYYGLSTVLPIATLISILLLAHVCGRLTRFLGTFMPGRIVPNSTAHFRVAADDWTLRKLWVCHPDLHGINGLNTLNVIINEAAIRAHESSEGHHRLRWVTSSERKLDRYRDRVLFAKGLLAVALLMWGATPMISSVDARPTARLAQLAFLLLIWIVANTLWRISGELQVTRQKISSYLDARASLASHGGQPKQENWSRDSERLKEISNWHAPSHLWTFHFLPPIPGLYAPKQLARSLWQSTYHRLRVNVPRLRSAWQRLNHREESKSETGG